MQISIALKLITLLAIFIAVLLILLSKINPPIETRDNHREQPVSVSAQTSSLEDHSLTTATPLSAQLSLADEVREILNIGDDKEHLSSLEQLLVELDANNITEILAVIESNVAPSSENTAIYELLLSAWASFASQDAINYAMTKLDNELRLDAGMAAVKSSAVSDVYGTALILETLPETYGKDYLIYNFAYAFVDQAPEQTLKWTRSLPDNFRNKATYHAYRTWLEKDEEMATEWVVKNVDFKVESSTLELAALHWARKDLAQVDAMIAKLPNTASKTSAMSTVVDWLAAYQPEKVADWLNQHDSSKALNPVLGQFALSIATTDYESALSWAEGISSTNMREYYVEEVNRKYNNRINLESVNSKQ